MADDPKHYRHMGEKEGSEFFHAHYPRYRGHDEDHDRLGEILSEEFKANLALQPNRAERFSEICYKLWSGEEKIYDEVRQERIKATVDGIVHCSQNPRPKLPGTDQEIWDQHYLNRQLRLETFFSPKECMEVFVETGQRQQKFSADKHGPSIQAKIVRVRGHLEPNKRHKGKRKESLVDCTLEYGLKAENMTWERKEQIQEMLLENGLPRELKDLVLSQRADGGDTPGAQLTISHTSHALISNMCVAARGYHRDGLVPPETGTQAVLHPGYSKEAVMGLRTEDAEAFVHEGPGKGLSEDRKEDVNDVYLNHVCGISRLEETGGITEDGAPKVEEKFGRISFFLGENKLRSGILEEYCKVLRFAETKRGRRKIANMLHPAMSKDASPEEIMARRGSQAERIFAACTSHIEDISKASYEHIRDALYLGGGKMEQKTQEARDGFFDSILQVTCVGRIDSSAIRATSTDQGREAHLRALVERVGKRSQDPKRLAHAR